jgi:beta-lactamase class A
MFDWNRSLQILALSSLVAVHDLETGSEYLFNADEAFHPASTMKIHVMMEVFNQVEKFLIDLDDELQVVNSFKSAAGGDFAVPIDEDSDQTLYDKIGLTEKIGELVRLMIVRSSNLATNILIDKVSIACINALSRELGIQGVSILRGLYDTRASKMGIKSSITARGLMQTLQLLAEEKVVSKTASREMINILLAQEFNEGIPAGLPRVIKTAHKTGWDEKIYHDAAIVFPEQRKPYVLVVHTRGIEKMENAHDCVASISKIIYEQIQ